MEIYTDGIGDYTRKETNTKKRNLYSLKLKLLSNKFNKTKNENNKILKDLENSYNKLKLIEKINLTSDIEFKLYKNTERPANVTTEKTINQYRFFVTMIGIIDGILDNINHNINFELNFINPNTSDIQTNEELNKLYEQKKLFLEYRNLILNDYKQYSKNIYPEILNKVINNYPSHNYFSECFDDSFNNLYQAEFISAYTKGYSNSKNCDFIKLFTIYKNLFFELIILKIESSDKIETAKRK